MKLQKHHALSYSVRFLCFVVMPSCGFDAGSIPLLSLFARHICLDCASLIPLDWRLERELLCALPNASSVAITRRRTTSRVLRHVVASKFSWTTGYFEGL